MTANFDVRAPLFDRLVDLDPTSASEVGSLQLRTLDRRGLRLSVRRELQRLFSSISSLPAKDLAGRERTVIDYGIPDFSTFSPRSHPDRTRLALSLRRAIEAFEPRLREVKVTVESSPDDHLALLCNVSGVLIIDRVAKPVSFPTVFRSDSGEVEVHADS